MKLRSLRALAGVALCAALVAPLGASAPRETARENGLLAAIQREFERSSQLLEQFWDSAFGAPQQEESDDVVVVLVEEEDNEGPLTLEEKTLACRVAVERVDEQRVLAREAQRMSARLRTPMGRLVSFHFEDETSCDDLATPRLVAECERVLEMDKEIAAFLEQGRTAEEICDAVQMMDEMVDSTQDPPPLSCKLCKRFVAMVVKAIAQDLAHVQEVREILGDICDSMSVDSMCHTFLKQYDDVVNWLIEGTSPDVVCQRLMMCSANEVAVVAMHDDEQDHACYYCEHIVGVVVFVEQHAPRHLPQVRKLLHYACKLSPSDCKCDETVQQFDKIVDLTKQGKSPVEVCQAIGMCKKQGDGQSKLAGLLTNPLVAEKVSSLLSSLLLNELPMQTGDDKTCFYCEYFTTLLEVAIQENPQGIDQVRQYADMICGLVGDNKYCKQYVTKLDTVIDAIKSGKKPREICSNLQYCVKKIEEESLNLPVLADDKYCFYCEYFVTLLDIVIREDQADIDQIRQYADMICGLLGDDNVCHQYVSKFDSAIDMLKQGKKPREVCTQFQFCTKSQQLALPSPPALVNDDKTCFYCDYLVTVLEIVIQQDKADVDQVREFADLICGMLGDDNVCHQYVGKLDAAIDGLKQGKKPREICAELKYCAKALELANVPAVRDNKYCLYCDYFVTILEVVILNDESDIDMFRQYADMICGMLGDDNVCHQYVRKIDTIVDELKQGKKSHDICTDVEFCTKSQHQIALPSPVATSDAKTCAYCDYFATILQVALQEDPNDVDALRLYAGIICGMLGDGNVCHQYLSKFEYAIDALNKGKKPRQICTEFKYCGAKFEPIDTSSMLKGVMVKSVVDPIEPCFFCTQVANLIKVAVAQDPSQVSQIRTVADLICKTLPAANKCHKVMQEMDQIIDSIKKGEEPGAICQDMNFCKKASESLPLPATVKNNKCAYCDGVATVLQYAIKSKPDQVQQIREIAGIVCDLLPQDDTCHKDLKMLDSAIAAFKSGKSPHDVCLSFGFCSSSASTNSKFTPLSVEKLNRLDAKALETDKSEKSMSMGCLLCEYTAEALVFIKGSQSELRLAKQALETMCMVLPPTARCDVLSSKFDNLAELVSKGKSPSQACHALSLCDAAFVEDPKVELKRLSDVMAEQRA